MSFFIEFERGRLGESSPTPTLPNVEGEKNKKENRNKKVLQEFHLLKQKKIDFFINEYESKTNIRMKSPNLFVYS